MLPLLSTWATTIESPVVKESKPSAVLKNPTSSFRVDKASTALLCRLGNLPTSLGPTAINSD